MASIKLIAYGMNLLARNMPGWTRIKTAKITGDRLGFYNHATGFVTRSESDSVWVAIWESHNPAALDFIDQREGYPFYYDRRKLSVKFKSGETSEAWLYTMQPSHAYGRPTIDYVAQIEAGMLECGFPDEALESLEEAVGLAGGAV